MKTIPPIWIIFTILFMSFSIYSFVKLTQSIPHFEWKSYADSHVNFKNSDAIDSRRNLEAFIVQWNGYVDEQNKTAFWINLIAGITYLISAFMTYFSIDSPRLSTIKESAYNLWRWLTGKK